MRSTHWPLPEKVSKNSPLPAMYAKPLMFACRRRELCLCEGKIFSLYSDRLIDFTTKIGKSRGWSEDVK